MLEAPISPRLLAANKVYYAFRSEEAQIWQALRWAQSSAECRELVDEAKRIRPLVEAAMDERWRVINSEAGPQRPPLLVFPRAH